MTAMYYATIACMLAVLSMADGISLNVHGDTACQAAIIQSVKIEYGSCFANTDGKTASIFIWENTTHSKVFAYNTTDCSGGNTTGYGPYNVCINYGSINVMVVPYVSPTTTAGPTTANRTTTNTNSTGAAAVLSTVPLTILSTICATVVAVLFAVV